MNNRSIFCGIIIALLGLVPHRIYAQILINEIAWMGTVSSSNAEWIELYNSSDSAVSLDGWIIQAQDGSPKIGLVGPIEPHEYYLLERTSDDAVPAVGADSIYSGSLGNSGEQLKLINDKGETIDDLDFSLSGWPAGDNNSKDTMQRVGVEWITASPTPGSENHSSVNIQESELGDTVNSNQETNPISNPTATTTRPVVSKKTSREEVEYIEPNHKYRAQVDIPEYAVQGTPIPFKVTVHQDNKRDMVTGRFDWYLGDGGARRYFSNTAFEHIYHYPGEYLVVLEYYSNSLKEEIDSIHKKKITIIPDALTITQITPARGITIKNSSTKDIDLNRWRLLSEGGTFTFPKYTFVKKGGELTIPSAVHLLASGSELKSIRLMSPTGVVVSVFEYGMLSP